MEFSGPIRSRVKIREWLTESLQMRAVQLVQSARDTVPPNPAGPGAVEDSPFGVQQRIRSRITRAQTATSVAIFGSLVSRVRAGLIGWRAVQIDQFPSTPTFLSIYIHF